MKQRLGALGLLEQLLILSGAQMKQLKGGSPQLEQYLRWALDNAALLEIPTKSQRAMTDALRS